MILYPGVFWPFMMALQTSPRMLLTVVAIALGCGMVVGSLTLRRRCRVPPGYTRNRPRRGP